MNTTAMNMNMNADNNAIEITYASDCAIPCLRVTCKNPTNCHGGDGYLMPFRAYRFQVCLTVDGVCDCASSNVRAMKEQLSYMPGWQQIEYLREEAIICLMRWQENYKYGVNLTPEQEELFEQFLLECRDWVMSR